MDAAAAGGPQARRSAAPPTAPEAGVSSKSADGVDAGPPARMEALAGRARAGPAAPRLGARSGPAGRAPAPMGARGALAPPLDRPRNSSQRGERGLGGPRSPRGRRARGHHLPGRAERSAQRPERQPDPERPQVPRGSSEPRQRPPGAGRRGSRPAARKIRVRPGGPEKRGRSPTCTAELCGVRLSDSPSGPTQSSRIMAPAFSAAPPRSSGQRHSPTPRPLPPPAAPAARALQREGAAGGGNPRPARALAPPSITGPALGARLSTSPARQAAGAVPPGRGAPRAPRRGLRAAFPTPGVLAKGPTRVARVSGRAACGSAVAAERPARSRSPRPAWASTVAARLGTAAGAGRGRGGGGELTVRGAAGCRRSRGRGRVSAVWRAVDAAEGSRAWSSNVHGVVCSVPVRSVPGARCRCGVPELAAGQRPPCPGHYPTFPKPHVDGALGQDPCFRALVGFSPVGSRLGTLPLLSAQPCHAPGQSKEPPSEDLGHRRGDVEPAVPTPEPPGKRHRSTLLRTPTPTPGLNLPPVSQSGLAPC
nr:collagen alpha-1(I) chain [Oryctolagus cuniculus]